LYKQKRKRDTPTPIDNNHHQRHDETRKTSFRELVETAFELNIITNNLTRIPPLAFLATDKISAALFFVFLIHLTLFWR